MSSCVSHYHQPTTRSQLLGSIPTAQGGHQTESQAILQSLFRVEGKSNTHSGNKRSLRLTVMKQTALKVFDKLARRAVRPCQPLLQRRWPDSSYNLLDAAFLRAAFES